MLFKGCILKPSDNSGIKTVRCIRIINKTKVYGSVGDLLGVMIKSFKKQKKLLKKTMYYGLIVSTKAAIIRIEGTKIVCDYNRIVLLSNKEQILSTRLFGPIYKEIRNNFVGKGRYRRWRYDKVVSYAKKVI